MHWAEGLARRAAFREGFSRLDRRGLAFEAWMYHTQLPDLIGLLRGSPDAKVVINHLGGRIAVGRHAAGAAETTRAWERDLATLAEFPNVQVKLGGLGMALAGHALHERLEPPSSEVLAATWRPAIETCLGLFGGERCMFESNFPVDKAACSYGVLWNAYKRLTAGRPVDERAALFHDNAARLYGL